MRPESWQRLDQLFHAALEREPAERAEFLAQACMGDERLRREVESLIATHEQSGSFIEAPAADIAVELLGTLEPALTPGLEISHYRIISPLGSGGMGDVYLAQDTVLSRQVALKLLPNFFTRDPDRLHRFQQEARAASALNHPNIITIHEIGQVDDRHFIATEFIDGATLRQNFFGEGKHTSGQPVQLRKVLDIAIQTADALAAAHEAGIVHRDIKPENIMVRRRDSYVKVVDFGLAKLTQVGFDSEAPTRAHVKTSPGMVMGTVSYMSPEQARGEEVDARTDIWSLGVVVFEMLAGCTPFERTTQNEVLASILGDKQTPPLARYSREAPPELERIVNKALTKDREERYQTAKDLLIDLRRLRQQLEVEAEIERTAETREKSSEAKEAATSSEQATITTPRAAVESGYASVAHSPSLIKWIKLHQRAALIVLATLVAVTAVAAYFTYSRLAAGSKAGTIRSVAVMPFINAGGNSDAEYLSDGLTDSLITSLSQLPRLSVKARSSVFRYKGKEASPQQVGRELNVQAILNGRIVQRGNDLTLHIELVEVDTESALWSGDYNRSGTNFVSLPNEIAHDVATKLRLTLSGLDEQKLKKIYTSNPEAYNLYLQGGYHASKWTEEGWKKSLEYYNRAIDIDPTYALAYTGLANSYVDLGLFGAMPQKDAYPRAKAAALKALELDDSLAEAHASLGAVKELYDWDFAGAKSAIKRAIEINPNRAGTHQLYGYHFIHMGQFDEAIAEMRRAVELDPLTVENLASLADAYIYARQPDQAIEQCKKALEMDKNYSEAHFFIGRALEQKGMHQEAITEFQQALELSGGSPEALAALGHAYAVSGQRDKARKAIDELKEQSTRRYIDPGFMASIYAGLGAKDEAFHWLEKAYEDRSSWLVHAKAEPDFDSLRSDSRFIDLLRRVGL